MSDQDMYCPRRAEGYPEFLQGVPDTWECNRWSGRAADRWPADFERPRTCSFCGGVHVDDALALIEKGWEIGLTTKRYKLYLHPPGSMLHHKRTMAALETGGTGDLPEPTVLAPVPPVKLYGMHATADQLERLNQALKAQFERQGVL